MADTLQPVLRTRYTRCTLADLEDIARLTVDSGLECRDRRGRTVSLGDHVIVETKTAGRASAADRWLWARGRRPERISTYATGLAALDPGLPANRWHRTSARYLRPEPSTGTSG